MVQQQQQQQQQQCMEQQHKLQLEQQYQHTKRRKQHADDGAEHVKACASAAAASDGGGGGGGDSSTTTGDAASGSADTQQAHAPWQAATATAAAADAAWHDTSPAAQADAHRQRGPAQQQPVPANACLPGGDKRSMQAAKLGSQQLLNTSAAPAGCGSGSEVQLLWRYERAQLAYDASVTAAAAGDKEPAAVPGAFVLPWAQRQPWEWEWEQRQQWSPRARAAAGILMSLSGDRL
ncbi:hypothetical protein COO60DRAFT_1497305 [Scenedesmus sp. NREL 46B-D3]|nr:hypothetical protein COO60DRAFT_1497305 [Scenedesmus sp. NREL 46B-D3]